MRADTDHDPGLFWAVKGGGGSVGVVTALEMALYPVAELYAGTLFFPIERASEVLHAWREWTDLRGHLARAASAPPTASRGPPAPARLLRGRAFALVEAAYLGDALAAPSCFARCARWDPSSTRSRRSPRPHWLN